VNTRFLPILLLILIYSCSGSVIQTTVFSDGFSELDPVVIPFTDSVNPAIYFQPERGIAGQWTVATSLRQKGFSEAWEVRKDESGTFLVQTFNNLDKQNEPLSLITHPMVVAGDSLWKDYKIEVDFSPQAKFDKCGVVFGYQHPNDFYFFGIEGNTVILKHVMQSVTPLRPIEKILAHKPLVWTPGDEMRAIVTLRRNDISVILNDSIRMYEGSEVIRQGRIGLISDLPAKFNRVEVKMLKGELRQLNRKKRLLERRMELHLDGHPAMVRWKAMDIAAFGTDQNIRLGDLTGDGNKEIIFTRSGKDGSSICCISAMTLDGKLIWQYGNQRAPFAEKGLELPVQIHDLDGDGQREVIFVNRGRIGVLDGKSGKLTRSVRIAGSMVPSTIMFGDLLGTGRDNCLLLSDRENQLAVFNEKLELLWDKELEGGSQPVFHDMNGDGHDDVLIGYSAFDDEGNLLFNSGQFIGDRCNGLAVTELVEGDRVSPCILYAAGDWGLLYMDFEGNLLKQEIMGHVNYLSVADFDMESAGLEIVTSNSWGSDGLIHIVDASGKVRTNFLPASGVSRCVPVNWKGDGEEFFIISADTIAGGMYDKFGQLSVRFPADGHPETCYMVQDLTGDARDEVLVWDNRELWIYTQDDNPRMGKTSNPDRIPLYNQSMHQMSRSLPGW